VRSTQTQHRIDVSEALPAGYSAEMAVTVFAGPGSSRPRVAAFAFPGGGYTRGYFDLRHPSLPGPGQAEYHRSRGWVFVACDPLGVADSTPLDDTIVTLDASARAAHLAVRDICERLRTGTLTGDLGPVEIAATIGIGHSLGGMQLIHQQAALRTFTGVAVLGFSAVHTVIPVAGDGALAPAADFSGRSGQPVSVADAWSGPLSDDIAHLRYAYHWEDVPDDIIREDMSVGFPVRTARPLPPWVSATFPPFAAVCMAPGVVREQAASIEAPVFVGAGERDVLRDLRAEAAAYSGSRDITLTQIPRCAHMHNFSPRRLDLWHRLHVWGESVPVIANPPQPAAPGPNLPRP
jgi:hypothetical protein